MPPSIAPRLTADELARRTYATFLPGGGMRVDLKSYFATPEGKAALRRLGDLPELPEELALPASASVWWRRPR